MPKKSTSKPKNDSPKPVSKKNIKQVPDDSVIDNSIWGILPGHLNSISKRINAYLSGDLEIEAVEEPEERLEYLTVNNEGIAVMQISGTIKKRLGFWDWLFGDASDSTIIAKELQRAVDSQDVNGMILHIDSPGGMVDGTREIVEKVEMMAAVKKPVFAYTDGQMASAAYWIGSASERVYAYPTSQVGSIGVVAMHIDRSELDKKIGIKRTFITKGKYKRIANDAEPLTEEGREYIQEMVDETAAVMFADIADNRKMTTEQIESLEGRLFLAQKAKDRSLVDALANFNQVYTKLKRRLKLMNYDELNKDYPDAMNKAREEGLKGASKQDIEKTHTAYVQDWRKAGAEDERKRISDIRDAAFEGQDEMVNQLIADGTNANDARGKLIADQKTKMTGNLDTLKGEDPGDLGANPADSTVDVKNKAEAEKVEAKTPTEAGDQLDKLTQDLMSKEGDNYEQAFTKVCKSNPKLYEVYMDR
jgi:signal peptide peptidase SppA